MIDVRCPASGREPAPLALMSVRFRQPAARPPAQRMNLAHAADLAARLELI
jgi:hypothetical protein